MAIDVGSLNKKQSRDLMRKLESHVKNMDKEKVSKVKAKVDALLKAEGVTFAPGSEFTGCQIRLPDSAPIPARLVVRNLFRLTTRNGVEMLRAGCQFSGMPRGADEVIQRYILKIERERSARQRALG